MSAFLSPAPTPLAFSAPVPVPPLALARSTSSSSGLAGAAALAPGLNLGALWTRVPLVEDDGWSTADAPDRADELVMPHAFKSGIEAIVDLLVQHEAARQAGLAPASSVSAVDALHHLAHHLELALATSVLNASPNPPLPAGTAFPPPLFWTASPIPSESDADADDAEALALFDPSPAPSSAASDGASFLSDDGWYARRAAAFDHPEVQDFNKIEAILDWLSLANAAQSASDLGCYIEIAASDAEEYARVERIVTHVVVAAKMHPARASEFVHLLYTLWADELSYYTLVLPDGGGELHGRDHFPVMVVSKVSEYFTAQGCSVENLNFLCELARLGWYHF